EAGGVVASRVDPVRRVSTLLPGGLVRITDYAGQPYDIRGVPVDDPALPAPGSGLGSMDMTTDEFFFPAAPPSDPIEFGSYLADAFESGHTAPATDAMERIAVLQAERILTPPQNAALVEYLTTLPDLALLGESTDRLGRPVIVFAAPINPKTSTQAVLMFGAETGRVAASETIYRGTERTDISSPAVLEYMAWEAP
ncbi:MAG: hypothetical protein VB093_09250, partial [Propionicimonas sp.]|nr:hypothetical protein [Propionicimonas sp.]